MSNSEKAARALGAGTGDAMTINGKPAEIAPVGIKNLLELQRVCLRRYQREYLENFKENLDLLEKTMADFETEVRLVGRWTQEDLPQKTAYDYDDVLVTPALVDWLVAEVAPDLAEKAEGLDRRVKLITAAALDNGALTEGAYRKLTGRSIRKGQIPYVSWWVTGTMDGMVALAASALKGQGISEDDIMAEMGSNFAQLAELSREIESITTPSVDPVGNESGPETPTPGQAEK